MEKNIIHLYRIEKRLALVARSTNQIYRDKIYFHGDGNEIFSDSPPIEESISRSSHLRTRFFPAATRLYGLARICRLKLAAVSLHLQRDGVACVGVGIDPAATRGCRKVLELKIHGLAAPSACQVP